MITYVAFQQTTCFAEDVASLCSAVVGATAARELAVRFLGAGPPVREDGGPSEGRESRYATLVFGAPPGETPQLYIVCGKQGETKPPESMGPMICRPCEQLPGPTASRCGGLLPQLQPAKRPTKCSWSTCRRWGRPSFELNVWRGGRRGVPNCRFRWLSG